MIIELREKAHHPARGILRYEGRGTRYELNACKKARLSCLVIRISYLVSLIPCETLCLLCVPLCNNQVTFRVVPAFDVLSNSICTCWNKNIQRTRQHTHIKNRISPHGFPICMKCYGMIYAEPDAFSFHCLAKT